MKGGVFTADGGTTAAAFRVRSAARGAGEPDASHGMSSTQNVSRGEVAANARATASANGRGSGYELTGTPSKSRQRTMANEGRGSVSLDRRLIASGDHSPLRHADSKRK